MSWLFQLPWLLVVVFSFTLSTAYADDVRTQLAVQVKQVEAAYSSKDWRRVSASAQKLIRTPALGKHPDLAARVYAVLGAMFYKQKLNSLANQALSRALQLNTKQKLPEASDAELNAFYSKVQANFNAQKQLYQKISRVKPPKKPKASAKTPHIGWWLGWSAAIVGAGFLGAGTIAGVNAFVNRGYAGNILSESQAKGYRDPVSYPTIKLYEARAKEYASVATVTFIIGGVVSGGALGLILWSVLAPSPTAVAAKAKPPLMSPRTILPARSSRIRLLNAQ